jgi:hypothetical protein
MSPHPSPISSTLVNGAVRPNSQICPTFAGARKTNRCNAELLRDHSRCAGTPKHCTILPRAPTCLDPAPSFDFDSIIRKAALVCPQCPLLEETEVSSNAGGQYSSEALEGLCGEEQLPGRCVGRDPDSKRSSNDYRKEDGAPTNAVHCSCTTSLEKVPRDSSRRAVEKS